MQDYVWFLAAAGFGFGAVLSSIIWYFLASVRWRRAGTERDLALAELQQVRDELKSLYAAQRHEKQTASASSQANAGQFRELDERLAELSEELRRVRNEARTAKARETELVALRVREVPALEARNAYLETRVGNLERRIHEAGAARPVTQGPDEGVNPVPSKQAWQVRYLSQRVEALEEKLLRAEGKEKPVLVRIPDPRTQEQVARLRWRNQYLEERLVHFEEAANRGAGARPIRSARQQRLHPAEAFLKILDQEDAAHASKDAPG